MGNYTSNNQNSADKKMMVENGLVENKLLTTLGQRQQQQQQQPATTTADQQQQQQQQQCKNDIEMNYLNMNKKQTIIMDENDIKMILQTFNVVINQVLQEKLSSKIDGGGSVANNMDPKTKPSSTAPPTQVIFDNLAKMLSTHLGDYLEHCKRAGIVMEPANKSCTEYIPNNDENNINCNNNYHYYHNPQQQQQQQQQEQRSTSQQSWQSFNQLVVEQQQFNQSGQQQQQRRMSNFMSLQGMSSSGNNNTLDISHKNIQNNLNNLVNVDNNIRINLPEILDQQDEVTIMRLLIKLLSNKVRKLSDENRYLLQQISALNDINTELASILQHKFGK